jgi:hypothetical protein
VVFREEEEEEEEESGRALFFGVFFRVDARWASRRADLLFFFECFLLIIFLCLE